MRPEARQWLKIAVSDCELGRIAFKKGMYPQAIYLYCQAIEKALKASQIEYTHTVPKKFHYLDVLAIESRLPIEQQQIVQLKELSRLYSRVRYPEIPFAYQIATGITARTHIFAELAKMATIGISRSRGIILREKPTPLLKMQKIYFNGL